MLAQTIRGVGSVVLLLVFSSSMVQGNEPSCTDPGILQNGFITGKVKKIYLPGETIHFYCNDGYILKGSPKIECEKNGKWTSKLPQCIDHCNNRCQHGGKCEKLGITQGSPSYNCACPEPYGGKFCDQVVCPKQPTILNGDSEVVSGSCASFCGVYSKIQYSCREGFKLQGTRQLVCQSSGDWSSNVPTCEVVTCRNKLNPPNRVMLNGEYSPKKEQYQYGEEVSFRCSRGFVLVGDRTVKCESNGFWSSFFWPRCQRQQCPAVVGIEYGNVIWEEDSRALGTKVRYSCARGHYLYGEAEQVCTVSVNGNAVWSGRQPRCISRELFEQYCAVLGKIMVVIPEPRCEAEANTQTVVHTTSTDTMTIVTGTAGGILGFLLVVIAIVACQRRRLVRRMRLATSRPGRSWSTEEDRMAFICYSNDVRFFLPSYDEAMRTCPPDPPPFEAVADARGRREGRTGSASVSPNAGVATSTSQDNSESDEHAYETIDALPVPRPSTNVNEPIYAAVQRVLSPFARTITRLSSSGSQGETTVVGLASDIPENQSHANGAVAEETALSSDSASATSPVFEAATASQPESLTPPPVTQVQDSASKNSKTRSKKAKKGKKQKKDGAKSWQLSVKKADEEEEIEDKDGSISDSGAQSSISSESIVDEDESKPLISN